MQELTRNAIEAEKDFNVKQRLWTEENAILQSRNRSLAEERDRKDKEVSDAKDQLYAPGTGTLYFPCALCHTTDEPHALDTVSCL